MHRLQGCKLLTCLAPHSRKHFWEMWYFTPYTLTKMVSRVASARAAAARRESPAFVAPTSVGAGEACTVTTALAVVAGRVQQPVRLQPRTMPAAKAKMAMGTATSLPLNASSAMGVQDPTSSMPATSRVGRPVARTALRL